MTPLVMFRVVRPRCRIRHPRPQRRLRRPSPVGGAIGQRHALLRLTISKRGPAPVRRPPMMVRIVQRSTVVMRTALVMHLSRVGGVIGQRDVLPHRATSKRGAAPNHHQLMAAHPVQVREAVPASPPQLSRQQNHHHRVHQTQDVQRDRVGKVPDPGTLPQPSATRAILSKEIGSGMGRRT